jgi:uncharacterized cupin superfamily protein
MSKPSATVHVEITAMNAPILNIADVKLEPVQVPARLADKFGCRRGPLGGALGARLLGYNVTVVPPGKRAFPFHVHHVNEEMFFILEGEGELRYGKERYPLKPGDTVACLAGDAERAHQIINTSKDRELHYLSVSSALMPEILDYPDSGKFGVVMENQHGERVFEYRGRRETSQDYWEGEG